MTEALTAAEQLHAASEHALDAADERRPEADRDRSAVLAATHALSGMSRLFDDHPSLFWLIANGTDRLFRDLIASESPGTPTKPAGATTPDSEPTTTEGAET